MRLVSIKSQQSQSNFEVETQRSNQVTSTLASGLCCTSRCPSPYSEWTGRHQHSQCTVWYVMMITKKISPINQPVKYTWITTASCYKAITSELGRRSCWYFDRAGNVKSDAVQRGKKVLLRFAASPRKSMMEPKKARKATEPMKATAR